MLCLSCRQHLKAMYFRAFCKNLRREDVAHQDVNGRQKAVPSPFPRTHLFSTRDQRKDVSLVALRGNGASCTVSWVSLLEEPVH